MTELASTLCLEEKGKVSEDEEKVEEEEDEGGDEEGYTAGVSESCGSIKDRQKEPGEHITGKPGENLICEPITCDRDITSETIDQAASVVPVVCASNPSEAPTFSDSDCDSISRVIIVMGEEYVECALDISICDIPNAPPLPRDVKVHHLKHLLTVVPEILPSALYIEYRRRSQLQEGDIVAIRSVWGWQSYTLVSSTTAGGEKMICFVNNSGQPVSDMDALLWREGVRLGEVGMEEVLGMEYGPVTIIRQENRDQTLRNARSALGREWSLFHFNSEHFVTWATTGEAICHQLLNLVATPEHCGEELISDTVSDTVTAEEAVKSAAKAIAIHLTKETAEEAVSKSTAVGLGKQMASGAKAGLFGGVVVEGACLAYSVHGAYQQMQRDEISQEQFRHHTVKQTGAAGGSVAGGVAGAAIGSVVIPIPVVGTIVGGVVGGIVGSVVGSKVGEATDDAVFGSQ